MARVTVVPTYWVEPSGENRPLAAAELRGAAHALGGRTLEAAGGPVGFLPVSLPSIIAAVQLADRLGLARRVVHEEPSAEGDRGDEWLRPGGSGETARFRVWGAGSEEEASEALRPFAARWVAGGGRIDLRSPTWTFFLDVRGAPPKLFVEVARSDRPSVEARRMPRLPFQRPVSLPPRLGRVAGNLAAIRPGYHVIDPFVGTGALALELAMLGARVSGVDRDATMVRGTAANLGHHGVSAEQLVVGDAAETFAPPGGGPWDALVTDPPYGRASGLGGEAPEDLLRRVLPPWADRIAPEGRLVVIAPTSVPDLLPPWRRIEEIPARVHRSLTRRFCVFAREPATGS
jgi:putative methyltransferase (TIGR01177 family)